MNTPKFRIWDNDKKRFLAKGWQLGQPDPFIDDNASQAATDNENGCIEVRYVDSTNLVCEQFTGVNDKHGKNICEGDIVKTHRAFTRPYVKDGKLDYRLIEGEEEIGEVIYYATFGKFLISYEWKRHDDFDDLDMACARGEVVGNIHENSELLKK